VTDDHTVEYAGPRSLSATAAEPEPARVALRFDSGAPEGTEVCVTAADYRAHAEPVGLDRLTVDGCSSTGGDIEVVEAGPATSFSERSHRRLDDADGQWTHRFRLARVRSTTSIDRGDRVRFDLGVGGGAHAGNDLALGASVRPPDADAWTRAGQPVVIPVRAGPPAGIEVRPRIDGSRLSATVFATDALLNPTDHPDSVTVETVDGAVEGLPTTVSIDDGPATVTGRIADGPVRLRGSGSRGEQATSALVGADTDAAPGRPLFGAIHFHTRFSGDGGRPMADAYRYARDVLNLDFAAATDHSPGHAWDEIAATNERFDAPGEFVTLPAWEWSTDAGHANLYLRSPESTATPDRAYDADYPYHADWPDDTIMAPHHTNQRSDALNENGEHYWNEYDWSVPNDRMGFVEVHQSRGNFETDAVDPDWRIKTGGIGASVRDALAEYRLGFVGGTDNHTGYPTRGSTGRDDLQGRYCGLTGVYAGERKRAAIWDALEARRTYATTGVPIRVGFAVNGEPLGGVAPADGGDGSDPTFDAALHGTAPIERVEVVADGETVWLGDPNERDVRIDGEALPDPGAPGYYYLRLRQSDAHMAWASPVWVDG
jgi:hypothetical protein